MDNKSNKFLSLLCTALKGATVCFVALFIITLVDAASKEVKIKKK